MTAPHPDPHGTGSMSIQDDLTLLDLVRAAARTVGDSLLAAYDPRARPANRRAMFEVGTALRDEVRSTLQASLASMRPDARWVDEAHERERLPPGEWWVVDEVEGAVNFIHGTPDWAVSIALLRDNVAVLAVIYQAAAGRMYTAVRGGGAFVNGEPIHVSDKRDLADAIVGTIGTGSDDAEVQARVLRTLATMLGEALLLRMDIPSTFPILQVASGHADVFWQLIHDLQGLAGPSLFVSEAGGVVSTLSGEPWDAGSPDIVVSAPGLHAAVLQALNRR